MGFKKDTFVFHVISLEVIKRNYKNKNKNITRELVIMKRKSVGMWRILEQILKK